VGWRREICKDISAAEKVIQLITGVHKRESCRHIFRKFQIWQLALLYGLEVLYFIKQNQRNLKH